MPQRKKENIMRIIRKYLMGMLYQRAEILAEYEPSAVIRDVYIDVMYEVQEEWLKRSRQGSW